MSYLVLARKWRPQQFSDVLGQEHVTQTLTNAIHASRVAHAFLFSGPRGVGKTSAARILAKALCCTAGDGPSANPCGVCQQCVEITEARSTDVFEIDAASHTGVDNVREIIENVRYLPSSARFKIYVIDEVHMLSTGAFNALLKTLEEPPAHVKFILATTDPHKVPVTILSRCQRYDFHRIPLVRIVARLGEILEKDGISHDASALSLIAREAEGSMRDAQSLLERVLATASGRRLDADLIRAALGVVDRASLDAALSALVGREPGRLIEIAADVYRRGLDLKRFGDSFVEYLRDLLVAKLVPDPAAVLDRPKDEIAALVEQARGIDAVALERWFDQLCRVVEDVGRSAQPRFTLEVGLASIAEKPPRVSLDALLAQLQRLETKLGSGAGPGPASGSAPRSGSGPGSRSASPGPRSGPPDNLVDAKGAGAPLDFAGFVALVRSKRPSLAGLLAQVRPLVFRSGGVDLGCETAFDAQKLQDVETLAYLEEVLTEYFGLRTSLRVERRTRDVPIEEGTAPPPPTLREVAEESRAARAAEKSETARTRPSVQVIAEEFGASIAKVRLLEDS